MNNAGNSNKTADELAADSVDHARLVFQAAFENLLTISSQYPRITPRPHDPSLSHEPSRTHQKIQALAKEIDTELVAHYSMFRENHTKPDPFADPFAKRPQSSTRRVIARRNQVEKEEPQEK
jgi:hypothetical protein